MRPLEGVSLLILRSLFEAKTGLHLFRLFKRARIPIGELVNALTKMEHDGLVEIEEDFAAISPSGREVALSLGLQLVESGLKSWREIPEEFMAKQVDPWELYIPTLAELPKEFQIKIEKSPKGLLRLWRAARSTST